jgi:hypothetical protein
MKNRNRDLLALLVAGMLLSACGNGGSTSPAADTSASARPPTNRASAATAAADSGQGAGTAKPNPVADLCTKLDLKSLASAVPGTQGWTLASRQQIDDAEMSTGVTGARPQCMFYPASEPFGTSGPDDYIMLSQPRTEAERQWFTKNAALYGDNPAVPVGDQGFRTGVDGVIDFRVGQNWFEVWARVALPGGDFDHDRSAQVAMQLARGLASTLSGSR